MKKIYVLLISSLVVASCAKDNIAIDEVETLGKRQIYATIHDDADTRVQLNELVQTVWTAGDVINIYGPKTYGLYKFDGQTGDRTGVFSLNKEYTPIKDKVTKYFAVYPGQPEIDYSQTTAKNSELITYLQHNQTYVEGSYSPDANVMFGSSDDGSSYYFKNLVSYLRVSITGSRAVRSIDFFGNNKEIVAGKLYINSDNATASFRGDDVEAKRKITLDCGEEGVQLSETPQEFYIVVPALTYSKGFSVVVNFTDGSTFPKSTGKSRVFRKNCIQPMQVFSTDVDNWQNAYIYHYGKKIVMPKAGGGAVLGCVIWGDGNSTLYGQETSDEYEYTDGEESHIVTVQVAGAIELTIGSCLGISKIDLSNF